LRRWATPRRARVDSHELIDFGRLRALGRTLADQPAAEPGSPLQWLRKRNISELINHSVSGSARQVEILIDMPCGLAGLAGPVRDIGQATAVGEKRTVPRWRPSNSDARLSCGRPRRSLEMDPLTLRPCIGWRGITDCVHFTTCSAHPTLCVAPGVRLLRPEAETTEALSYSSQCIFQNGFRPAITHVLLPICSV